MLLIQSNAQREFFISLQIWNIFWIHHLSSLPYSRSRVQGKYYCQQRQWA